MRDASLLGPWVRRFLMEHMTGERNLARNTQRSYRDTLRLLLPSVARRARKPIERLAVIDVSADRVRQFLNDLEEQRGCGIATRNQRLAAIHALPDSSDCTRPNCSSGVGRCAPCRSRSRRDRW
jgi:site-specific recombinase XerD